MAFLFVVHVPYDPKSDQNAFGEDSEKSEETVLIEGKSAGDLDATSEEHDTNKENTINGWVETDESLNKARDSRTTNENLETENAASVAHDINPNLLSTESGDESLTQKSDVTVGDKISDSKSDEKTVEPSHSEDSESIIDNETEDQKKSSEEKDDKEVETVVGSTKKFDVIPVEESEVESLLELAAGEKDESDSSIIDKGLVDPEKPLSEEREREDGTSGDESEGDKTAKTAEEKCLTPLIPKTPVYKEVLDLLEGCDVENVTLQKVQNDKLLRISFVKEDSKSCEDILNKLKGLGVGRKPGSSISVFPTSVHESFTGEEPEESTTPVDEKEPSVEAEEKESKFKKSIKSRLIVQQVVDSVRGNAEFTFDYLLLIVLASVFLSKLLGVAPSSVMKVLVTLIACMGLVENSSVVLVASMLISPLMGPILAGTFGHVIKVYELRDLGVKSEVKGLIICVVIGFIFGLISGGIGLHGAVWGSSDSWPTIEMKSRGMLRSLWVGMLIAIPSGAGVAIGVLGGNAGSLVGVAISASLLPPAVNAGMLWAYGILAAIKPPALIETVITTTVMTTTSTVLPNITNIINSTAIPPNITTSSTTQPPPVTGVPDSCAHLVNNGYRPVYSCNISHDAALLGLVSLFLTVLNITCIFFMGILVLRVKEVAPETAATTTVNHFWHEDVKVARTYYQTSKGPSSKSLGQKLLKEWQKFKEEQQTKPITDEQKQLQQNVETISCVNFINDLESDPTVQRIMARLSPSDTKLEFLRELSSEYQLARDHVNELYRKDPSIYLSRYQPKARNKKVDTAYHTIHSTSSGTGKPSLAELRSRFRKGQSMFLEKDHSDTDISPSDKKPRTGFLLSPTKNKLFKRRKQVKFEESEMEEGQNLV